jgi:hypothetical protein
MNTDYLSTRRLLPLRLRVSFMTMNVTRKKLVRKRVGMKGRRDSERAKRAMVMTPRLRIVLDPRLADLVVCSISEIVLPSQASVFHMNEPHSNSPLHFFPIFFATEPGNILTVADDLLKNDGRKFLEMMEQLAERRMQREEEAALETEDDSEDDSEDEEDSEEDSDSEGEDEVDDKEVGSSPPSFLLYYITHGICPFDSR